MIRRPPRSTPLYSSAASDVYKRQELGYERWREERGYGVRWRVESLFSAVKRAFGESVRATSFAGQVVEAKLKFWAYAWMVHLANYVVGRAPGIKV